MKNEDLISDIIEEALTYRWVDKKTGERYNIFPDYEFNNGVIHIFTPVKPYKLVVLRRLLYIGKISYKNIVIGNPDI